MRQYREPITVHVNRNRPVCFSWRNRHIRVDNILDRWVARSRWWSQDETRFYLQLDTSRGTIEVYRSGALWYLSRVVD